MKQAYNGILSLPLQEQPSIHLMMAQLAEAEIQYRLYNRTQMYLKLSKLRYDAMLEQIHCTTDRNLTKESIQTISDCGFINRGENILITGSAGCGKSFLACGFGHKTLYFSMSKLLERIAVCKFTCFTQQRQ